MNSLERFGREFGGAFYRALTETPLKCGGALGGFAFTVAVLGSVGPGFSATEVADLGIRLAGPFYAVGHTFGILFGVKRVWGFKAAGGAFAFLFVLFLAWRWSSGCCPSGWGAGRVLRYGSVDICVVIRCWALPCMLPGSCVFLAWFVWFRKLL